MKTRSHHLPGLLLLLALAACQVIPSGAFQPVLSTALPVPVAEAPPQDAPPPVATDTVALPSPLAPTIEPSALPKATPRPRYSIGAVLDYNRHTLQVSEVILSNAPIEPLHEIVLVVEPNRFANVFSLRSLAWLDGVKIDQYSLEQGVLRVPLAKPLESGAEFGFRLSYTLTLPNSASFLGYTLRQFNLGDWYPFLPAYREGEGWLVREPSPVGEHLVYPAAEYAVGLTFVKTDRPLIVAASAPVDKEEGNMIQYRMAGARGFAISISPDFQVLEGKNGVKAYVFAEHRAAGQASLEAAEQALALYSDLFAPYPYPGLSVVEADFFDGMEYSGLFFLGSDYFGSYSGRPVTYLVPLSAHETAHQWWYSLVGDDPANEPWLDESFCTYSELLFYQKYYPDLVDWWWEYRITRFYPQGKINITIYDQPAFRPYVDAVYLQGARFLHELRQRMGDTAFFALLKDYAAQYSYHLVSRSDFLHAIKEHTTADFGDLEKQYFR